jgi:ubiquinone/menaquinone biosynthesis C-methylase UbiE
MLARAREKDTAERVTWLVGDVERLELARDSFDCALMSLMLHHLDDHLETFRGVLRVLRPGGVFLIRQGTLEQIINDVTHRFFPETVTLDRKRTPLRSEVEGWLAQAGFRDTSAEEVAQTSYPSNENFLERFNQRVCSVLRMIGDDAFEEGMKRLREYMTAHPEDASVRQDLFTLFTARKPQ